MLDILEIRQHFIEQMRQHIALLHPAMQMNQLGQPPRILGLPLHRRLHAPGQDAHLFLKAVVQAAIVADATAQQQQRHRHVQGDEPCLLRPVCILRERLNLLGQILQGIVIKLPALRRELPGILDEFIARHLVAPRCVLQAFFGNAQHIAHGTQNLRHLSGRQRGKFGQIGIQCVGLLDLCHQVAHAVAASNQVKHFIQGQLRLTRITLGNRAYLLVYAPQQLAPIQFGRQSVQAHAIEQPAGNPPECAAAVLRHAVHHAVQRLPHRLQCGRRAILPQQMQQTLLILAAQGFQAG